MPKNKVKVISIPLGQNAALNAKKFIKKCNFVWGREQSRVRLYLASIECHSVVVMCIIEDF